MHEVLNLSGSTIFLFFPSAKPENVLCIWCNKIPHCCPARKQLQGSML
jgi:hypothetical protein